jgi:methionyl-tRNA formyltransferase
MKIVVATIKSWNISLAQQLKMDLASRGIQVHIITDKNELTLDVVRALAPRYIFFPHWSWIIPEEIFSAFECVVFHMTDLPFGRGGSPLQNLIVRGIYETKISAIRVVKDLDAGAIYAKEPLSLARGSADDIFRQFGTIVFDRMIPRILFGVIEPREQQGVPVSFKRRAPHESDMQLQHITSLAQIYDFVRMLDGEGYPKAFLKIQGMGMSFSEAELQNGKVVARVEITLE